VDAALDRFAPHEALAAIWDVIGAANKYVDDVEPWALARRRKSGGDAGAAADARLATALYNLVETLRLVAHYCSPFIPAAAEGIARQLGLALDTSRDWAGWGRYPAGTSVQPGGVLFPKLEGLA
ncbi:MAG: methionine--tRNA ligase, partial [Anaerolineae bacterium]